MIKSLNESKDSSVLNKTKSLNSTPVSPLVMKKLKSQTIAFCMQLLALLLFCSISFSNFAQSPTSKNQPNQNQSNQSLLNSNEPDEIRIVPQLGITSFTPREVKFLPDSNNLIAVLNADGRIDIFDISQPNKQVKTQEFFTGGETFDAGKTKQGNIVFATGNSSGLVRLWNLHGNQIGKPFEGHTKRINSIAISTSGQHIISGSDDNTLRLWDLQGNQIGKPFVGHEGSGIFTGVNSVAFSPDEQRIVSGSRYETLRQWDLQGNQIGKPSIGHKVSVESVAFSPDGQRIISGSFDNTLQLWDLQGNPIGKSFVGHEHYVKSVTFSPDGQRIVSGSFDNSLRLWDLQGSQIGKPFIGHKLPVTSVAFSPDGQRIVSCSHDNTLRLWSLQGEQLGEPFKGHVSTVSSVAFSPDGQHIVSGSWDDTLRLWDMQGEQLGEPFKGHNDAVYSVAFSPDGQYIISGSSDNTLRLWDLQGEQIGEPFKGHEGAVFSVAFSPDGQRIISGSYDNTLRLWDVHGKQISEPFKGHVRAVSSVAFSPDGQRIVSGSHDNTLRLWDVQGKQIGKPFVAHKDGITSVAFSPDGQRIVSGSLDNTLHLWNLQGKQNGEPFVGHKDDVTSVAFSPDGQRIVSGSRDNTLRLWNLDGNIITSQFKGHKELFIFKGVISVAFSPDGQRIVSGSGDTTLILWGLQGKQMEEPFVGFKDDVTSVAFSPDRQRIVSGSSDNTLRLWDGQGRQIGEPFKGHKETVTSAAFSPDEQRIVSGSHDDTLRLWDLQGKQIGKPFVGHKDDVTSVAFSPNGLRIVSGSKDNTLRLWNLQGKQIGEPFKGHLNPISSITFSPDGEHIVSGSWGNTLRLWNLQGNQIGESFIGHKEPVISVTFSPDGQSIVSSSYDGTIRLWDRETKENIATHPISRDCNNIHVESSRIYLHCADRSMVFDQALTYIGNIFYGEANLVGIHNDSIYVNSSADSQQFLHFTGLNTPVENLAFHKQLTTQEFKGIFFDQWSWQDQLIHTINVANQAFWQFHNSLPKPMQYAFEPALIWLLLFCLVFSYWIISPWRLVSFAMLQLSQTALPNWNWLLNLLLTVQWFSLSRRSLASWIKKYYPQLSNAMFFERKPVLKRQRYHFFEELPEHAHLLDAIQNKQQPIHVWLAGSGGNGKSALAFYLTEQLTQHPKTPILPVLIDEDWQGSLEQHLAAKIQIQGKKLSTAMVVKMGQYGLICPVIDSISERQNVENKIAQINESPEIKAFTYLIFTSRNSLPTGAMWEKFATTEITGITPEQLQALINTYAPQNKQQAIANNLQQLIATESSLSPLFVRLAIEQLIDTENTQITTLNKQSLVVAYVEGLRMEKLDVDSTDLLRAVKLIAYHSLVNSIPNEFDEPFMHGVLNNSATESAPFYAEKSDTEINPKELIRMLDNAGILERKPESGNLQFAYDPIAEVLAQMYTKDLEQRRKSVAPKTEALSRLD